TLISIAVALPVVKLVVLKMLPFDNKSELQVVVDMPEDSPMENTRRVLVELSNYLKTVPEVESLQLYAGTSAPINFNGLVRQYYLRNASYQGDIQVNLVDKHHRNRQSHEIALSLREPLQAIAKKLNANIKLTEVPPGPPVMSPLVAEVYGATAAVREATVNKLLELFKTNSDIVDADSSMEANVGLKTLVVDRQKANLLGLDYAAIIDALQTSVAGTDISYLHSENAKYAIPIRLSLAESERNNVDVVLAIKIKNREGVLVPLSDVVSVKTGVENQTIYHKDLLPVSFVTADVAGKLDSPLYGMFSIVGDINEQRLDIVQNYIKQPDYPVGAAIKWDGEWQITYETFRDMGIAYGVGMILIYLLIVAQFRSYLVPLIIMAPIPLTIIGVMPGHALFGAQFTATSMIGMIALAGIIVRNSILLVDFIQMQVAAGTPLSEAVVNSSAIRAKPILLTAFAASIGAFFILDDPIFNGLAIALIFGVFISTLLTLWVIPVIYYAYKH
ncbi:MAG TPA: efflux RND transporter permease subunit, partial [Pseudomonadales bacterium]|nr:efflux RND transporter permease subunit [Pseudomonadales bacterium]